VLVTNIPEWRHAFVDPGCGLSCDAASADSIAAALRWFLENPEARRAMGERGRRKIADEWNYQTMFAPVLTAILAGDRVAPQAAALTRAGI
jgi:glycosyltransferase involved in cell wall biosynthesis